jgi:hypothetical protein
MLTASGEGMPGSEEGIDPSNLICSDKWNARGISCNARPNVRERCLEGTWALIGARFGRAA